MADTTALKNRIRAAIKSNDNQEITGPVLQQTLLDIVDELDLNPELQEAINTEKNARQSSDEQLQQAINNETQTRQSADTQLNNLITGIKNNIDNGYVYAGIATPSTVPVSGKVFYIAVQAGTYTNLGGTVVIEGITILKYNGISWAKEQVLFTDGGVFDISAYHATGGALATYTDLSAALNSNNGGVPQSLQKGGTSVKYIRSSNNKYVQYFLPKNEWSIDPNDWEKMNLEEEVSQLDQPINDIYLNMGEIISKQGVLSTTPSANLRITIPGKFKVGDIINYNITLGEGVVLNDNDFRIFQNGVQTFNLNSNLSGTIQLNVASNDLQLYLYWQRVTTGGSCVFSISKDNSSSPVKDIIINKANSIKTILPLEFSITGKYIDYTNGNIIDNENFNATDYILITPNIDINYSVGFSGYAGIAFYDESKTYISGVGNNGKPFGVIQQTTIPNNAKYVRTCQQIGQAATQIYFYQVMQFATTQIRRDTAANWTAANPILAKGEIGIETDTNLQKSGNGTTAWKSLPYMKVECESGIGNSEVKPMSQKATTKEVNDTKLNIGEIISEQGVLSTTPSANLRITIPGKFKVGDIINYNITLGEGVVLNDNDFRIFQNGVQTFNLNSLSGTIQLNVASNELQLYLYWRRVTTGGSCVFSISKDSSLLPIKDIIINKANSVKAIIPLDFPVTGKYIEYSNGAAINNVNFNSTDFIEIVPGLDINYSVGFSGYAGIAFYDESKTYISGVGNNGKPFGYVLQATIPQNAKYLRTCQQIGQAATQIYFYQVMQFTVGDDETQCNYKGREMSLFDKCVCIGDSLTAGVMNYTSPSPGGYTTRTKYAFPKELEKLSGITVVNKGISGDASFEWYAQESGNDYSGYDCAIIQLGVNDAIRNMNDYGTAWNERSDIAFSNIVNMLKTANPKIKIFVATIIPAISYSDAKYIAASQAIRDWHTQLNDPDVILVDIAVYGHTADSIAYNCGHLSAFGYWRLAADYYAMISYYMNTHKDEFRQVQFIGSNYSYEN